MHRLGTVAAFAFCIYGRAADLPQFHATVRLVKADTYVYDRYSRTPVFGLQASDFVVFDDGERRDVAYFADESGPVDIIFLLDISGTVREILPQFAGASTAALTVLERGDRAAVMAFTTRTVLTQPLSEDFEAAAEGINAAMSLRIGLDTDINQSLWSAADYLHGHGGRSRRAILILTDNVQETRVPDSLVREQLAEADAVLDGFLVRGPIRLPRLTHPGILGFARDTGGEVMEGDHPSTRLAEMIRQIKFRYSIHFRAAETTSREPRKIRIDLTADARRRYPNAVVRSRRIYFPQGMHRPKPDILPGQIIAENLSTVDR